MPEQEKPLLKPAPNRWMLVLLMLGFLLIFSTALVQAAARMQDAGNGVEIFNQKCASCHTMGGGDLVGPDLQGITSERDEQWLVEFILNPDEKFASGDPIALELLAKYNNIPMPNLGLSEQEAWDVIAYLSADVESTVAEPAVETAIPLPGVVAPAPPPVTDAQPSASAAYGQELYSGHARLAEGGTACIACHSVESVGLLGGGMLGPDLTNVYSRYGGEAGMAAVLNGLPFPSMRAIYDTRPLTEVEQKSLLAFFAGTDGAVQPAGDQKLGSILIAGLVITAVLFIVMSFYWPAQRKSISRQMRDQARFKSDDWRIS